MPAGIDVAADVFTLINTFHTTPERQAAIVAALRGFTLDHARSRPGLVAASVHAKTSLALRI